MVNAITMCEVKEVTRSSDAHKVFSWRKIFPTVSCLLNLTPSAIRYGSIVLRTPTRDSQIRSISGFVQQPSTCSPETTSIHLAKYLSSTGSHERWRQLRLFKPSRGSMSHVGSTRMWSDLVTDSMSSPNQYFRDSHISHAIK